MYELTPCEIQSKSSRIDSAERLIAQLPKDHEGRNTWLLNYGKGDEAVNLRKDRGLSWVAETEAAETCTHRPAPRQHIAPPFPSNGVA